MIEHYKKQRQEAIVNSMIAFEEMTDPKDKPTKRPMLMMKLHSESINGVVALIEKEIDKRIEIWGDGGLFPDKVDELEYIKYDILSLKDKSL